MDRVRKETTLAIDRLKAQGIYTIMLTGDSNKTAKVTSYESHVDEYIAECLPENKVEHLKQLKAKHGNCCYGWRRTNDAPALATANVGIAMGGGTDVALDTGTLS